VPQCGRISVELRRMLEDLEVSEKDLLTINVDRGRKPKREGLPGQRHRERQQFGIKREGEAGKQENQGLFN